MTSPAERLRVAAFDFDGTLTVADTLLPFLVRVCGRTVVARTVLLEAGSIVRGVRHAPARDLAKARVIGRLLRHRRLAEIEEAGRAYGRDVLRKGLRDDVLDRLRWHQGRGDAVVIISASLGAYLRPVAEGLGVRTVLCTELQADAGGRLTGGLSGANVRGPEKVRRLTTWLAGRTAELWAYGDSAGDRELLAVSDHSVHVGAARRRAPLQAALRGFGGHRRSG